eukprot:7381145-Prymnesium_polylepis.1
MARATSTAPARRCKAASDGRQEKSGPASERHAAPRKREDQRGGGGGGGGQQPGGGANRRVGAGLNRLGVRHLLDAA